MKEKYIEQVKRELTISRKQKKAIIRDLEEAFASAMEHGETEQQVIERLGTPREFASTVQEASETAGQGGAKRIVLIICTLVFAIASLAVSIMSRSSRAPSDAIGAADAMTNIQVEGSVGIDLTAILLVVGIAALVLAIIQIVNYIRKK